MAKRSQTGDATKTEPDPAVKRVIDRFHDVHLERFGFKPDPRGYGRLGKDAKVLLGTWGEDVLIGLVDEFFSTTDPRVTRSDYSVAAFLNSVQYLRVRRTGKQVVDERTAHNVDVVARATGRR